MVKNEALCRHGHQFSCVFLFFSQIETNILLPRETNQPFFLSFVVDGLEAARRSLRSNEAIKLECSEPPLAARFVFARPFSDFFFASFQLLGPTWPSKLAWIEERKT